MAEYPNVLTYQDVVEHMLMRFGIDTPHAMIRSAIKNCYEVDLPQKHASGHWQHYLTEYDLRYNATYTTGTITYDHTGGASERLLTFSTALSGDPLTNLIYYQIRIDGINYPIAKKLSSTTAQLPASNNPGEDVDAGTTFTLFRNRYTLPPDFACMYPPLTDSAWGTIYRTPHSVLWRQRNEWQTATEPESFTIMASEDVFGQQDLVFAEAPSADGAVRFLYYRRPRRIKYHGFEEEILATKLQGTSGANTVTLSNSTVAKADWVGRFIRFGDQRVAPTGWAGEDPWVEQHVVTAVSGATLTLAANLENTHTQWTKFRLVDPIDISPAMIMALLRGCEYQMTLLLGKSGKEVNDKYAQYIEAVRNAGEQDTMVRDVQLCEQMYRNVGWTHIPTVTE